MSITMIDIGLDKDLIIIRNLTDQAPSRQMKKEILNMDLDHTLQLFQNYMQKLFKIAPGQKLTMKDRIVILNCRLIFEGLHKAFYILIIHLKNKFSIMINNSEKVHKQFEMGGPIERKKTKKARKTKVDTTPVQISLMDEVLETSSGISSSWSFISPEAEIPVVQEDDILSDPVAIERELQEIEDNHEDFPVDYLRSLRDLMDFSQHLEGRKEIPCSEDVSDLQSERGNGKPSPRSRTSFPSLIRPPMEIIRPSLEESASSTEPQDEAAHPKRVLSLFKYRPNFIMRKEAYEKMIFKKKVETRSYLAKYYAIRKDKMTSEEIFTEELLDHGFGDLLEFPKLQVPELPTGELYLRKKTLIGADNGMIPFEFIIQNEPGTTYEPILKDVERVGADHVSAFEQRPSLVHDDTIRGERTSDNSLLPNDKFLSTFRRSLTLGSLGADPIRYSPGKFPRVSTLPVDNDALQIRESSILGSFMRSSDDVLSLIIQNCSEMETDVLRFTDICGLSNTKFYAAIIFGYLMELWGDKKISINQNSPHPNDIFVRLIL